MYSLKFTESAKSDLRKLDPTIRKRILKRLAWLEENVDYMRHQQLSGPLSHLFKSVIGDHRVLYDLDNSQQTIWVHVIRHRREIYR